MTTRWLWTRPRNWRIIQFQKADDLFATLAEGQKFTKLDYSQAYQQMLSDEDSRECLTINRHKGLFRPTCLACGVKYAQWIFQREMEKWLVHISYTIVSRSQELKQLWTPAEVAMALTFFQAGAVIQLMEHHYQREYWQGPQMISHCFHCLDYVLCLNSKAVLILEVTNLCYRFDHCLVSLQEIHSHQLDNRYHIYVVSDLHDVLIIFQLRLKSDRSKDILNHPWYPFPSTKTKYIHSIA